MLGAAEHDLLRLRRAAMAWAIYRHGGFDVWSYTAGGCWMLECRGATYPLMVAIPDDDGVPAFSEQQMSKLLEMLRA